MDRAYTIRRLDEADAPAYRARRLDSLARHPTAFGASHEEEAAQPLAWFADRLAQNAIFGGWDLDGQLHGLVALAVPTMRKTRHKGLLWGMIVAPEARGTGLAASLVARLLDHARDHVEEVRLTVLATNLPAIRLYARFGFRQYGVEPRALKLDGQYHDEVLMALSLAPPGQPG